MRIYAFLVCHRSVTLNKVTFVLLNDAKYQKALADCKADAFFCAKMTRH